MTPSPAPDRLTALIDEVVRCAAKLALDAVDSRECTCEDPEDGTCWFHLTPEQRVNSIAAVVALDAGYDRALAALRAEAASLQTEYAELRGVGGMLANVAFNLAQHETMTADDRHALANTYWNWDSTVEKHVQRRATTPEGNHAE